MKFFPVVLLLLLVFDGLKGLTLPQKRLNGGLNTTLQANFSGLYERRNPCNNEKMEASTYVASHEFHHHTTGENWCDYTQKCSTIIGNFLKSISNLIRSNSKHDGTFTFHVNTSISQKQADRNVSKDQLCSLPTIVIEATNCLNPEQDKKPKGLTDGQKQEVSNGFFCKQKGCQNLEKALEELSAIYKKSSACPDGLREETKNVESGTQIPMGLLTVFETTETVEPENPITVQNPKLIGRREYGNAPEQFPNECVTQQPETSDATDVLTVGGGGNQLRRSKLEIKSTGAFETVIDQDLPSTPLSFEDATIETSDSIFSTAAVTQQPSNLLYTLGPQLSQNRQSSLTTASSKTAAEESETIEINEYESEKSEKLYARNMAQMTNFYSPTVQPAESLYYMENQEEFSIPEISDGVTALPDYRPIVDRFEPVLPREKEKSQTLQKFDALPIVPLTSDTPSRGLGPQLDVIKPQPENSFGQEFLDSPTRPREGYDYPVPEIINEASSYSTSSEERAEVNGGGRYYPISPPTDIRYDRLDAEIPPPFQNDEVSGERVISEIVQETGDDYNTRPGQSVPHTPQVLYPYGSISETNKEETTDRFQSQLSHQTISNDQTSPVYPKIEIDPPIESLQPEIVLDEENTQPLDYLPTSPRPNFNPAYNDNEQAPLEPISSSPPSGSPQREQIYDETTIENFETDKQDAGQIINFEKQSARPPMTEPKIEAIPVTYNPQGKFISPLEADTPLRQSSQVDPEFDPAQVPDYAIAPPQNNRFVPGYSLTSDTLEYEFSAPTTPPPVFTTPLPVLDISRSDDQIISREPLADDYNTPVEQLPSRVNYAKPLQDFITPSYSESKSKTSTMYESETNIYNDQNQQAPLTGTYKTRTTLLPLPEPVSPVEEFESNAQDTIASEYYENRSNSPTTAPPDYGTDYTLNFDSIDADYPTTVPLEPRSETAENDNLNPAPSNPDRFSENSMTVTSQPLDYQTDTSLPTFQQPAESSENILRVQDSFPDTIQPQAERFGEIISGSSDVYSQQTSPTALAASASQVTESVAYGDRQNSSLLSPASYYPNEEGAKIISDSETQIPQPQPSFDYSGQLSDNEREFNTASETAKTFQGSESNFQLSVKTYPPSPSVLPKLQTFTTESDAIASDYPLPVEDQPEPIATFDQPFSLDETEPSETYNDRFTSPPLMAGKESLFISTDIPVLETYPTPITMQDVSTTPRPQAVNSAIDEQEIVDNRPMNYQQTERYDFKPSTPQPVLENSNLRSDADKGSTALTRTRYEESSQQFVAPPPSVKMNQPKTVTYPQNFGLISTTRPSLVKTTIDEEITTDGSVPLPPGRVPPPDYPQRFPNVQFEAQRPYFLNSPYPENRPVYYPLQRQNDNYPEFNPDATRPTRFDYIAREQYNRFPSNFQRDQFSNRFQPGLDMQRDRFPFSDQPPSYVDRYTANERPTPPSEYLSFQRENYEDRNSQYRPYQFEERLGERNLQFAPPYVQNYDPAPYRWRNDFNQRNYQRFYPDQIVYDQIRNQQSRSFLNDSNQQVEGFDRKTDINQAEYEEALSGLVPGERPVKFDEEVITVSPEEALGFDNVGESQQARQKRPQDWPTGRNLPQAVESFGPRRPSSLLNSPNRFPGPSPQSNANFVNPTGGSEVGSNPSQSDSYALGPDRTAPSRQPGSTRDSRTG